MSQAGSIAGGGGGSGTLSTLTGNSGGAVSPTGGNINVVGSGTITVTGNPGTSTLTIADSGGTGLTFDSDSGSATPALGVITMAGGSNINTSATGSTVTYNLDDNVTITGTYTTTGGNIQLPGTANNGSAGRILFDTGLAESQIAFPDNQNIVIGYTPWTFPNPGNCSNNIGIGLNVFSQITSPTATGVTDNVGIGRDCLSGVLDSASLNVAIGTSGLSQLQNGNYNLSVGDSLGALQTGDSNCSVGSENMLSLTAGSNNTSIGDLGLSNIVTGSDNIGIGNLAGSDLTGSDSDNICIANIGVSGDNGVIRIGTDATHTSSFMAGIYGVTPAMSPQMMTIGSDGELGSQAISGGFTWNEVTGTSSGMAVNNGYIANNAGLVTLTLPASAALGSVIEVAGKGSGGWSIAQNSGQTIHFGAQNSTTGAGGSISSTLQYDTIRIVCTTADTDFVVLSSVGNLTVV
jgi:hypothetical protein